MLAYKATTKIEQDIQIQSFFRSGHFKELHAFSSDRENFTPLEVITLSQIHLDQDHFVVLEELTSWRYKTFLHSCSPVLGPRGGP